MNREHNDEDDRSSSDSSACPESPGEVVRSTTMSDAAKFQRTAKHIRHCYMFPDEKGKHDALNIENYKVKLLNAAAEKRLSGLYGSDIQAHWKRLTPLILERRDAVKGTQRALRAMQEKESAKARLLQNPLIADTARARRLLEGHEQQLAESTAKMEYLRRLLRDRRAANTAVQSETGNLFEGKQQPQNAWNTTSAAELASAASSSSSIGERTLPSPRPSMGRSESTTEGESGDGPRPRSSIISTDNARRDGVAHEVHRTPSPGYIGSSHYGGSWRPPGSSSSGDASVGDNGSNARRPELAHPTVLTSSAATVCHSAPGRSKAGENHRSSKNRNCSRRGSGRDSNASLVAFGRGAGNGRCTESGIISSARSSENDASTGLPAILNTQGPDRTSSAIAGNTKNARTNNTNTASRTGATSRRSPTRSYVPSTIGGHSGNGACNSDNLRKTSTHAADMRRSDGSSKGAAPDPQRNSGIHVDDGREEEEKYAGHRSVFSGVKSHRVIPSNAHSPVGSVVGGGNGYRHDVASNGVRIASPQAREIARASGESSISSRGSIGSIGWVVSREKVHAELQTAFRTISAAARAGDVDGSADRNTDDGGDDTGSESQEMVMPRTVAPEEGENHAAAGVAEGVSSRSPTSSSTSFPLPHQSYGGKTEGRDSDVARIHGRPSQAKRSVFLRQSLRLERAAREKREQEVKDLEDGKKQLVDEVMKQLAKSQRSERKIYVKLEKIEEAQNKRMEDERRKVAVAERQTVVAAGQAAASEQIVADVQRRLIAVETETEKEVVQAQQRVADVKDHLARVAVDVIKAAVEENAKTATASGSALTLRESLMEVENARTCAGEVLLEVRAAAETEALILGKRVAELEERHAEVENARRCAEDALLEVRGAAETEALTLGKRVAELEERHAEHAQKALDARDRAVVLEREVPHLRERVAAAEDYGAKATQKIREVRASAAATECALVERLREQWETRCLHLHHECQRTVVAEERVTVAELEVTQLRERLVKAENARVAAESAVEEVRAAAADEIVSVGQRNAEEQKKLQLCAAEAKEKAKTTELNTAEILERLVESEKARALAKTAAEAARATVEERKTAAAECEATHAREHLALKNECKETVARAAKETRAATAVELASFRKRAVKDSDARLARFQETTARKLAEARQTTEKATEEVTFLMDKISTIEQREAEANAQHRRSLEKMESRLKARDEQQARLDCLIAELRKRQLALGDVKVEVAEREAALAAAKVLRRSPDALAGSATAGELRPESQRRRLQEEDDWRGRRSPKMVSPSDVELRLGRGHALDSAEMDGDVARVVGSNCRLPDRHVSTCALSSGPSGAESYNGHHLHEGAFHSRSQADTWSGGRGGGNGRKNDIPIATYVARHATYSATLRAAMARATAAGARAGVIAGTQAAARSFEDTKERMASDRSRVGTPRATDVYPGMPGTHPPPGRPIVV